MAGLYFVGASTHPGAGMPGVLMTAKVLERVLPPAPNGRPAAVQKPDDPMPFSIDIMPAARAQLAGMSAGERRLIQEAVAARLRHEPVKLSRAIKLLRPNPAASHELRVGDLRVLYDVDVAAARVTLKVVGRKVGNVLLVEGEAFHGHQDDTAEPTWRRT